MFYFTYFIVLFSTLNCIQGISVRIDGFIDLGSNWFDNNKLHNIKDDMSPGIEKSFTSINALRLKDDNIQERAKLTVTSSTSEFPNNDKMVFGRAVENNTTIKNTTAAKRKVTEMKVTKLVESNKYYEMYDKPHKVKDVQKLIEFTKHIYMQTLKVFDAIKDKVDNHNVKSKVDFLSRNYEKKFQEFVQNTHEQNIKTKLGTQKVIINTIDTSNRILKRLVNYLIGDMNMKGILRGNMAVANVLLKEVGKEIHSEYTHACVKFGICRNENSFAKFLTDAIGIILKNDDRKLKQACDAFTEVLKDSNSSKVMDEMTEKNFHKQIDHFENLDGQWLRSAFMIINNILTNKNRPMVVMSAMDDRVNKAIALLDVIDSLEKALPDDEANTLEWNDIRNSLKEWSEGKRNDIMDIMQTFANHLKNGIEKMDAKSLDNVKNCLNIILS